MLSRMWLSKRKTGFVSSTYVRDVRCSKCEFRWLVQEDYNFANNSIWYSHLREQIQKHVDGDPALCQVVMQTFLPVIKLEAYTILALKLIDWAFVSITEAITAVHLNSGSGQRLSHCPLCLIDVLFESISWLHQAFSYYLAWLCACHELRSAEYAKMPSQLAGRVWILPHRRDTRDPSANDAAFPATRYDPPVRRGQWHTDGDWIRANDRCFECHPVPDLSAMFARLEPRTDVWREWRHPHVSRRRYRRRYSRLRPIMRHDHCNTITPMLWKHVVTYCTCIAVLIPVVDG